MNLSYRDWAVVLVRAVLHRLTYAAGNHSICPGESGPVKGQYLFLQEKEVRRCLQDESFLLGGIIGRMLCFVETSSQNEAFCSHLSVS